ncbi:MAG: hypothetical protein ACKO5C_02065 [Ferruginibacter sp.]
MRYIKGVLLGVVFLGLLITGISLLMPSSVHSAESVTIYSSRHRIESQLHDLRSWPSWFPFSSDSITSIQFAFVQTSGRFQAVEWTQKNQMNRIELWRSDTSGIYYRWLSPGKSPLVLHFSILPVQDQVFSLNWTIHTITKWYPWDRFSGIFFDQQVKPGQKQALEKLKAMLEQQANTVFNVAPRL